MKFPAAEEEGGGGGSVVRGVRSVVARVGVGAVIAGGLVAQPGGGIDGASHLLPPPVGTFLPDERPVPPVAPRRTDDPSPPRTRPRPLAQNRNPRSEDGPGNVLPGVSHPGGVRSYLGNHGPQIVGPGIRSPSGEAQIGGLGLGAHRVPAVVIPARVYYICIINIYIYAPPMPSPLPAARDLCDRCGRRGWGVEAFDSLGAGIGIGEIGNRGSVGPRASGRVGGGGGNRSLIGVAETHLGGYREKIFS